MTSSNTDMDELNSIMLAETLLLQSPITLQSCLPKSRPCCGGRMRPAIRNTHMNGADLHLESSVIEYNGQKAELTKNELKILYYLY